MNYLLKKNNEFKILINMLNKQMRDFSTYNKLIRKQMRINRNIPIFIDEYNLFFPTKSYRNYDCIWINYEAIKTIENYNGNAYIIFKDNTDLLLDVTYNKIKRVIENAKRIKQYFAKFNYVKN